MQADVLNIEVKKTGRTVELPEEIFGIDFERFREKHPRTGERIVRNLAQLLADRLIVANTKVDLLTAN